MADAKDFLFEIGTEEMPSAPLNNAVKQLGTMIAKGLDEAGLAHGEVRVISTPRRSSILRSSSIASRALSSTPPRSPSRSVTSSTVVW